MRRRRPLPPGLHAGLGSAILGDRRRLERVLEALAPDLFTLARRKAALLAWAFVSSRLSGDQPRLVRRRSAGARADWASCRGLADA